MGAVKLTFFALGTLAFFAAVYLAIKHPELVEVPGETNKDIDSHPLRKWDRYIAWVMWAGWGIAALLYFLGRVGVFDAFE